MPDRLQEPSDAAAEFEQSARWLDTLLAAHGENCVVVTHTAPSLRSIATQYRGDILSASFASNLDHIVNRAPDLVRGHTHVSRDYRHGGCRGISNPRGYTRFDEDLGFNPALICPLNGT